MIKLIIAVAMLGNMGCGVQHRASGSVATNSNIEVTIDVTSTLCDREDFTPEQIIECVKAVSSIQTDINIDMCKGMNTEATLECVKAIGNLSNADIPVSVLGVE